MSKIALAREVLSHNPACNKLLLSKVLHVARSLLYYQSKMTVKDARAQSQLETIHKEHPWYGHRRIAWSMGICFERARRLMKRFHIEARVRLRRKFVKHSDIWLPDTKIPNRTKDICPIQPNVIWRTDFTHIIYHGVHVYLATVIDSFTREIIGYSISFVHTKEFALEAIKMAIEETKSLPLIFHSDQWSEYRSFLIMNYLTERGIQISMSKKWSPWENWWQESYYGKFKLELDFPNRYKSIEDLILSIHERIYYYNYKRIHTALKMPPKAFVSLLKKEREEVRKNTVVNSIFPTNTWELHSSHSQESLLVYAQETGELTSTPVSEKPF